MYAIGTGFIGRSCARHIVYLLNKIFHFGARRDLVGHLHCDLVGRDRNGCGMRGRVWAPRDIIRPRQYRYHETELAAGRNREWYGFASRQFPPMRPPRFSQLEFTRAL